MEDVFLLAAPKEDVVYDPKDDERRAHAIETEIELLKKRRT